MCLSLGGCCCAVVYKSNLVVDCDIVRNNNVGVFMCVLAGAEMLFQLLCVCGGVASLFGQLARKDW